MDTLVWGHPEAVVLEAIRQEHPHAVSIAEVSTSQCRMPLWGWDDDSHRLVCGSLTEGPLRSFCGACEAVVWANAGARLTAEGLARRQERRESARRVRAARSQASE